MLLCRQYFTYFTKTKRTLIEAFVYKVLINQDDVDIQLYLDNLIDKNWANIGGANEIKSEHIIKINYDSSNIYIYFNM